MMNTGTEAASSQEIVATQHDWRALVMALELAPHPEGGYFREVFRSENRVEWQGQRRSAGTSIHYLLAEGAFSAWHRIDADETWYFHAGHPLALHVLEPDGTLSTQRLGNPLSHPGARFQAVVPAGRWFAAELEDPNTFCLVGCAVAPGFEFSGFELATESDLAPAVEQYGDRIRRLLKTA